MNETFFGIPPEGTFFHDRDFLAQCLTVIENHIGDHAWLVHHIELVHKVLCSALEVDPLVHRAINNFIRIIPDFMLSDNYNAPLDRAFQALLHAMDLKDPNLVAQVASTMASFNPLKGNIPSAYANVKTALSYAKEATDVDAILRAYVRVIEALSFRNFKNMPPDLVAETLHLVNFTEDPRVMNEVHLVMAHMFNYQQDAKSALHHGHIAFSLADQLRDNTYKMRALLMLGVTHRLMGNFAAAEDYVQCALELRDGVTSERRIGYMLCELAGLRYDQKNFAESERLYLEARRMFTDLRLPYNIVLADHGLGLVWLQTGRYDEARTTLLGVLDEYRWNDNTHGVANINYALGRCEARAGNPQAALTFLRTANGLLAQLEPSPSRDEVFHWTRHWIDKVQSGEFGTV